VTGFEGITREWLRGKNVTVVGLARSGIASSRLLVRLGAKVTGTDSRKRNELSSEISELEKMGVMIETAGHTPSSFEQAELVILSPGVPGDQPLVRETAETGVPVTTEVELAFAVSRSPFVAITGTNGKTTTTAITGELMQLGFDTVEVAGNIGVPLSSCVLDLPDDALVVAEISSFQLDFIIGFKPKAAALLNVTVDHTDRYDSFESYIESKARIFMNQRGEDYAVYNSDDKICNRIADGLKSRKLAFSTESEVQEGAFVSGSDIVVRREGAGDVTIPMDCLALPGIHNVQNFMAALCLASAMDVDLAGASSVLRSFRGVEHRLEEVAVIDGVRFVNDSKATNVESTLTALRSFDEPLVVILGGYDKGADFSPLAAELTSKVKAAVLYGESAGRLRADLESATELLTASGFEDAVIRAFQVAEAGEIVLLSPACASFDLFTDFEERGKVFKTLVHELGRDRK
jgi:UDP-N-acetylmuramoylalanine--D-glutamate ligase